ncbi:hypothetical protein MHK_008280 [Candidatus Magnetomorum sp. HK-1]|nr:hypothetical protein MHK_008280 [Candidatus Magnetomorum sp. HK-1]
MEKVKESIRNILYGFGSVMDIYPKREYRINRYIPKTIQEAFEIDRQKISKDFRKGIQIERRKINT